METDWYVIRFVEIGEEIPPSVSFKRTEIRTEANDLEARIDACKTLDELMAVLTPEPTEETEA